MARPAFAAGGFDWWIRDGADPVEVERLVRCVETDLAQAPLPGGARKQLRWLTLGDGPAPDHLLKVQRAAVHRPRRRSRARRELAIAERLAARGVPVALPVAAGERRRAGRVLESRLLSQRLPGFADLATLAPALDATTRRTLARAAGVLAARAHAAGLHMADFTATNLLVRASDPSEVRLIDFERARLGRAPPVGVRARMLAVLERSLEASSRAERQRFLLAYAAGDRDAARRWWQRVGLAAAALAARDERRLGRATRRRGRRFRPVALGSWHGVARSDVPDARLATVARAAPPPSIRPFRLQARVDLWELHYTAISPRRARQLFARALALHQRGLGVRPLALLRRGADHRILCERNSQRPHAASAASAVARLRERLAAYGRLLEPLSGDRVTWERDARGRLQARLIAPHAFRFAT